MTTTATPKPHTASRRPFTASRRTLRVALAALVAASGMAASTGVASAAGSHVKDEITFTSHAYLTPQPDGTSRVVMLADSCTLKADGGAAMPCKLVAWGTVNPDLSGEAEAVVTTRDRVIYFDEVFSPTGPASGLGTGTVKEYGPNGLKRGTFTAPYELAPTADPNVLLDWGTISITH